jgi:hypothetical protein
MPLCAPDPRHRDSQRIACNCLDAGRRPAVPQDRRNETHIDKSNTGKGVPRTFPSIGDQRLLAVTLPASARRNAPWRHFPN